MELDLLLHQIDNPFLSRDESARLRCGLAKRFEDAVEYKAARESLGELWPNFSERPDMEGLARRTAAEVFLRVGALVGWIGSTKQIADAQERAKNLISESMSAFEALPDAAKAAEAQIELAVCYRREDCRERGDEIRRGALRLLFPRN